MNKALETHFSLVDYTKNLLFYATTAEQEESARHIMQLVEKQEKLLYIEI